MPTTHDDEWDMPWPRYAPQTSYVAPVEPPSVDPDGGTLVQIPCLAREWIPFVLGALSQLQLPSTWDVANDDAMLLTLQRVHQLQGLIASWGACEVLLFDCLEGVPRYSTDDGATWTALPDCFTGPAGPPGAPGGPGPAGPPGPPGGFTPGPPGNPAGSTVNQEACNIAGYLAQSVIQASLAQAVASIEAGATLVVFASELVGVVLGLGALSGLLAGAAYVLYNDVEAGTLSDYTTASTSGTLRGELICAIYNAIAATGYVTDANFPAVLTAIAAIPYLPASVVTTIHDYVAALGATGIEQLQPIGALAVYDCTGCGDWCYEWNATHADLCDGHWVPFAPPGTATCSGGAWHAVSADPPNWNIYIQIALDPLRTYTACSFVTSLGALEARSEDIRFYSGAVGSTVLASSATETWTGSVTGASTLLVDCSVATHTFDITQITLRGHGTSPYGVSNCT